MTPPGSSAPLAQWHPWFSNPLLSNIPASMTADSVTTWLNHKITSLSPKQPTHRQPFLKTAKIYRRSIGCLGICDTHSHSPQTQLHPCFTDTQAHRHPCLTDTPGPNTPPDPDTSDSKTTSVTYLNQCHLWFNDSSDSVKNLNQHPGLTYTPDIFFNKTVSFITVNLTIQWNILYMIWLVSGHM